MQIQNMANSNNLNVRYFKSSNTAKPEQTQSKRDYLETKTEALRDGGVVLLLAGLLLNGHNFDFSKKIEAPASQKWGAGLIIAATATFLATMIKKIVLAKNMRITNHESFSDTKSLPTN